MPDDAPRREFLDEGGRERSSLVGAFWELLRHSKKWWMLPILLGLLVFGLLILLSGTAVAPFIYTLF
jgi:hypothetical protein